MKAIVPAFILASSLAANGQASDTTATSGPIVIHRSEATPPAPPGKAWHSPYNPRPPFNATEPPAPKRPAVSPYSMIRYDAAGPAKRQAPETLPPPVDERDPVKPQPIYLPLRLPQHAAVSESLKPSAARIPP